MEVVIDALAFRGISKIESWKEVPRSMVCIHKVTFYGGEKDYLWWKEGKRGSSR